MMLLFCPWHSWGFENNILQAEIFLGGGGGGSLPSTYTDCPSWLRKKLRTNTMSLTVLQKIMVYGVSSFFLESLKQSIQSKTFVHRESNVIPIWTHNNLCCSTLHAKILHKAAAPFWVCCGCQPKNWCSIFHN